MNIMVLTVAALMAVMFVAGAGYAVAYSYSEDLPGGGPSQGNITEQAEDNCGENFTKQAENEVATGGGPKAGEAGQDVAAPTNCDHFYQGAFETDAVIGKDKK
jgi:hypothetical protein